MRRCWSVWIPFFVLNLVLTLSMVSVGSTSTALVFPVRFLVLSPVRVLTEICICGRRRRTSSIRLSWGVDSCEDKALLVSLDTFRCPNLALTLSMVSVVSATKAIVFPVRISTKICICVRCRCRLFGSPEDVVVYPFSLLFPSPLFPLPYISPAFLSFPVSALVLACHML